MKGKLTLLILLSLLYFNGKCQNVGIGVLYPAEKLQVDSGNIKIGSSQWFTSADNRVLKFGDGNYVQLGEAGADDRLQFSAKEFMFNHSSSYTGYVGINTSGSPTANLEVNGQVKITDGTQALNNVLTSDANGLASWAKLPVAPGLTSFRLTILNNTRQTGNLAGRVETFYNTLDYDISNNTSAEKFIVPVTGVYHIEADLTFECSAADNPNFKDWSLYIVRGSTILEQADLENAQNSMISYHTVSVSGDLHLTANDIISINWFSTVNNNASFDQMSGAFSGYRIN